MSDVYKAREYLKAQGIDLKTTALITVIDGHMRQPDLCSLLHEYAQLQVQEYINKSK